ncbi:MAG: DUF2807 domain-containing protein, partial [Bacteroidota bacterium]
IIMKKVNLKLFVAAIFFCIAHLAQAQINGNGNQITRKVDVKAFDKIHINFPVLAEIDANSDYALEIITDENIFPEIVIKSDNGELEILQDRWIEPSKMVKAKIGTKHLKKLRVGGYGKTSVVNISEQQFVLVNNVGNVTLQGEVDNLKFTMNTGELYATDLSAQNVDANIWSHGEAYINVTNVLKGEISEDGKLVYQEKPKELKMELAADSEVLSATEATTQKKEQPPVEYVEVTLRNNRFSRTQTYVRGPKNKKFSYGMPFNPRQKRAENYPVGTQIFKVNKIGMRKLLVTIKAEDQGQVVDLFESE